MKQFFSAFDKESGYFDSMCKTFSERNKEKLKAGIFNGSQIATKIN